MGFRRRIRYYLVHELNFSNKGADTLIKGQNVEINGKRVDTNVFISEQDEIKVNGQLCRPAKEMLYLKFYKPVGFQSSLNTAVKDNISSFFKDHSPLAIAGRLDKASEGLLLLSNDGAWVETVCHPRFEKEKEYLAELDQVPTEKFIRDFSNGVMIGKHQTAPCYCSSIGGKMLRIILKEGKNRQIRRMCHALGYKVMTLKRVRVNNITLGEMRPGQAEKIKPHKV
jgi:23S rRNA pseudouridine2604 synthase